jgi:hypothetical protein
MPRINSRRIANTEKKLAVNPAVFSVYSVAHIFQFNFATDAGWRQYEEGH